MPCSSLGEKEKVVCVFEVTTQRVFSCIPRSLSFNEEGSKEWRISTNREETVTYSSGSDCSCECIPYVLCTADLSPECLVCVSPVASFVWRQLASSFLRSVAAQELPRVSPDSLDLVSLMQVWWLISTQFAEWRCSERGGKRVTHFTGSMLRLLFDENFVLFILVFVWNEQVWKMSSVANRLYLFLVWSRRVFDNNFCF